jgi:branched-chain amino acid aminotransferase
VHQNLLHNNQVRSTEDVLLSPGQVGYLNGWGIFSTFRVAQGVLFAFERHYARLRRDAALLRIPFSWSAENLRDALNRLIEANSAWDAVLRVAIIRNRGGIFEGPLASREVDLVAFTANLRQWSTDVNLTYQPNARFGSSQFAGTKSTSWAQNLTVLEKVQEAGFDEAVLLNELGQVSECTSANIFAVQGKDVYTPPLATSGCLPGITRAVLLEDIRIKGVTIEERELTPSQLEESDCVFITSTTRDLLPVNAIDGATLRRETEVFSALKSAFASNFQSYIEHAFPNKVLVNS